MVLNRNLQDINIQNMNVELVAQMFRNYRSNVQFHLEGTPAQPGSSFEALSSADDVTPQRRKVCKTLLEINND